MLPAGILLYPGPPILTAIPAGSGGTGQAPALPPIDATFEQRLVGFDFSAAIAAGDAISGSPAVSCWAASGRDDGASGRLLAPATLTSGATGRANTQVNQLFGDFIGGVVYGVQCVVMTTTGQELSIWCFWPCQTPGQKPPALPLLPP